MDFRVTDLEPAEVALREEVRSFLADRLPRGGYEPGLGMAGRRDEEFSRALGKRGWLGIALPERYGGRGGTAVERFVVIEELLSAGAPVQAHWTADRQTGPTVLLFGTEEQRQRFLPEIVAGRCSFSLGMSESEAGSDLAAVRSTARRVDGGWVIRGRKTWTSDAHRNHFAVVLCRTSEAENKHDGLSQLIVDLRSAEVSVEPIRTMDGRAEFCEVLLEDAFVPDGMVLGEVGQGWAQVTSELAYERAGPDRFLSGFTLLEAALAAHPPAGDDTLAIERLGDVVARTWAIRQMSLSVARTIDLGGAPATEAAVVKDLGTMLEQETLDVVRDLAPGPPRPEATDPFERLHAEAVLTAPTWTIRGGTNEVLRTIAARGLRARDTSASALWFDRANETRSLLADSVGRLLQDWCTPRLVLEVEQRDGHSYDLWRLLDEFGIGFVGVPEHAGGAGGGVLELTTVARLLGRFAAPVSTVDSALAAWLVARVGLSVPAGPLSVAPAGQWLSISSSGFVSGRLSNVPWAPAASHVVAPARGADHSQLVLVARADLELQPYRDLAGQVVGDVVVPPTSIAPDARAPVTHDVLDTSRLWGALVGAARMAGAMDRVVDLTVEYASQREQFGRPLDRFQAVQQHLVAAAGESALAGIAAEAAAVAADSRGAPSESLTAMAQAVSSRAATRVARAAHQVHGAMGFTREYELHLFTRRLWAWRDLHGSARAWARTVGGTAVMAGPDGLWPLISQMLRPAPQAP